MAALRTPVYFTADKPRRLVFRHQDVRECLMAASLAIKASPPLSITDLLNDPFFGWAYLLAFGLRFQDSKMSVSRAGELIDQYLEIAEPDGTEHKMEDVGNKLTEALEMAGYIKVKRLEDDGDAEGNGQSRATASPGTTSI